MTRLTLSVPQGSGTRAFKGFLVHSSVDGKIAAEISASGVQPGRKLGTSEEEEEVLLLRGDFPPDCTGFVTDVLSHCSLAVNLPQREAAADWLQTAILQSQLRHPPATRRCSRSLPTRRLLFNANKPPSVLGFSILIHAPEGVVTPRSDSLS